jgi:hypothetical protein
MSSKFKTMAIAATIALSVGLFSVQAAHAGGRVYIPFAPYGTYLPGAYDDDSYGCDDCGYGYVGDAEDAVAATAAKAARRYLGVDVEDVLDLVDE